MSDFKILTIIVTYNGENFIKKCLDSLQNCSVVTSILVVDNHSADKTLEIIDKDFSNVEYMALKENIGFGAANNIGLNRAVKDRYDFVFLLNQDAWIDVNCLKTLLKAYSDSNEFALLSPWHFNYTGKKNEMYFNDYVLGEYTPGVTSDRIANNLEQVYTTAFVHAAAWFIPVETIKNTGGFDPLFFYTGEDNDYVQRLTFQNKRCGILPGAVVYHKGSNTNLQSPNTNSALYLNTQLLKLKSPFASTAGVIALFFKNFLSAYKHANQPAAGALQQMHLRVTKKVAGKFMAILRSRRAQLKQQAYLNP